MALKLEVMVKRAILFLLCLVAVNSYAEEWVYEEPVCCEGQTFGYWNVGVGPIVLIPNVGIGMRQLNGHFGWDASLNVGSIFYVTTVQAMADALYIPNPQICNPVYFGAGIAVGGAFGCRFTLGAVAPDFLIGRVLSDDTFVEAHMQVPTWAFGHGKNERIHIPLITIKYGMRF